MKYYCFGSAYNPFSSREFFDRLDNYGFTEGSFFISNLVITRNVGLAKFAARLFPRRRVIVWTHEPSYDHTAEPVVRGFFGQQIPIFNVYTGNVFWHNRHFLGSYHYNDEVNLGLTKERLYVSQLPNEIEWRKRQTAVAIYAKKRTSVFGVKVAGKAVDLNQYRQNLAIIGCRLGHCGLVGAGWGDLAIEDSGFKGGGATFWWTRKIELMQNYRFNLAFENTNWPYYVTEKIWQAIAAGCLPVYWGKDNSIYESFARGSFVDASEYSDPALLWKHLREMEYSEWHRRMEKCINAYNHEMGICRSLGFPHFEETILRIKSVLES